MNNNYSLIISTFPDKDSAKKTARLLLEQRLAACVQILPIESIYSWQGKICEDAEFILFIKTNTALFEKVAALIKSHHSYEVPEIIQLPITDGLPEYLNWLNSSCLPV